VIFILKDLPVVSGGVYRTVAVCPAFSAAPGPVTEELAVGVVLTGALTGVTAVVLDVGGVGTDAAVLG